MQRHCKKIVCILIFYQSLNIYEQYPEMSWTLPFKRCLSQGQAIRELSVMAWCDFQHWQVGGGGTESLSPHPHPWLRYSEHNTVPLHCSAGMCIGLPSYTGWDLKAKSSSFLLCCTVSLCQRSDYLLQWLVCCVSELRSHIWPEYIWHHISFISVSVLI